MFGKKKEAESDYKLNRISKPTNFIFNIIFVIGAAVAIIPFLFVGL